MTSALDLVFTSALGLITHLRLKLHFDIELHFSLCLNLHLGLEQFTSILIFISLSSPQPCV